MDELTAVIKPLKYVFNYLISLYIDLRPNDL